MQWINSLPRPKKLGLAGVAATAGILALSGTSPDSVLSLLLSLKELVLCISNAGVLQQKAFPLLGF